MNWKTSKAVAWLTEQVILATFVLLTVIPLALLAWIAFTVVLSYIRVPTEKLQEYEIDLTFVEVNLMLTPLGISGADEKKLIVYENGGLEIYIATSVLESIPYPDRPSFVKDIGKRWCVTGVTVSVFYFPTVTFRDIRSGKSLARHSCFFGSISSLFTE